jgi:hypothetical protein
MLELEELGVAELEAALESSWSSHAEDAVAATTQAHAAFALAVLLHRLRGSPSSALASQKRLQRLLERTQCTPPPRKRSNNAAQRFLRAALAGRGPSAPG